MQKRIAEKKLRVARINRYVVVVAILWVVTSFALLFLSGSKPAHTAQPVAPAPDQQTAYSSSMTPPFTAFS